MDTKYLQGYEDLTEPKLQGTIYRIFTYLDSVEDRTEYDDELEAYIAYKDAVDDNNYDHVVLDQIIYDDNAEEYNVLQEWYRSDTSQVKEVASSGQYKYYEQTCDKVYMALTNEKRSGSINGFKNLIKQYILDAGGVVDKLTTDDVNGIVIGGHTEVTVKWHVGKWDAENHIDYSLHQLSNAGLVLFAQDIGHVEWMKDNNDNIIKED